MSTTSTWLSNPRLSVGILPLLSAILIRIYSPKSKKINNLVTIFFRIKIDSNHQNTCVIVKANYSIANDYRLTLLNWLIG